MGENGSRTGYWCHRTRYSAFSHSERWWSHGAILPIFDTFRSHPSLSISLITARRTRIYFHEVSSAAFVAVRLPTTVRNVPKKMMNRGIHFRLHRNVIGDKMAREPSSGKVHARHPSSIADPSHESRVPPVRFIGCCGAYCRACGVLKEGLCKGCKLGYDQGTRDIAKAKCAMKVCCFKDKHLETCADCPDYAKCERIQTFHSHTGYKYGKYKQSIEFIREKGYPAFLQFSDTWKGPYGRLE